MNSDKEKCLSTDFFIGRRFLQFDSSNEDFRWTDTKPINEDPYFLIEGKRNWDLVSVSFFESASGPNVDYKKCILSSTMNPKNSLINKFQFLTSQELIESYCKTLCQQWLKF